jgi:hypothetical protein
VTTRNEDESVNAAPFSFFNVFGAEPPLVIFAPGDRDDGTAKDTARNCERTGEFRPTYAKCVVSSPGRWQHVSASMAKRVGWRAITALANTKN